jgi:hypothetical protein
MYSGKVAVPPLGVGGKYLIITAFPLNFVQRDIGRF